MENCPTCGRHLIAHASKRCNWCGAVVPDRIYQEEADHERHVLFGLDRIGQQAALGRLPSYVDPLNDESVSAIPPGAPCDHGAVPEGQTDEHAASQESQAEHPADQTSDVDDEITQRFGHLEL